MEFDFSKNTVVDKLDGVPSDFHGLYVEAEGKFKLDSDDPKVKSAVSAVMGLNTALKASRAEARDAKGRIVDLGALADFGDTPDAIKEAITAQLEEARQAGKGKGKEDVALAVKAAQEALAKTHFKEVEARTKREDALTGQLHQLLITGEATSALVDAEAVGVDLALPHVVARVRVVEEDGQLAVRVKGDSEDEYRFSGTTGKHMTIKELVGEMREQDKFGPLFKAPDTQGGGGKPSHQRGRPAGGEDTRSSTEKIAAGLPRK